MLRKGGNINILAIGAHPDDLEVLCGGTLAKYSSKGHKVFMSHIANGNRGGLKYTSDELIKIRSEEAKNATEIIGAEYLPSGFVNDLEIYPNREIRDFVTDLFRYSKADVVLTLSPNDYSPDHTYTGKLVFDASHAVTIPPYKTKYPSYETPAVILYMDTVSGIGFHPEEYVDITDYIDKKKEMILSHKSQQTYLSEYRNNDFLEEALVQSRFRGIQSGVKYAEAFRCLRLAMRGRADRILP